MALASEMIAEGLVERDGSVLIREENGHRFMVETRLLDITETEALV